MLEFLEASYAGKILATLLTSMVPIVELRGGIPFGAALGLPPAAVMGAAIIGNMIPVPFIILFIKKIFQWMRRFEPLAKLVSHFESKAESKSDRVTRYKKFGLCIFVAVPLPGTGAWMGALIAALLDMRLRDSFPVITLGVCIASLVVTGITYGFISLF
ncbi:MAG: small multi-drug export protein [Anaerovoracaceae bacterium]